MTHSLVNILQLMMDTEYPNMSCKFKCCVIFFTCKCFTVTKQLLDEVEHDIMNNYQNRGQCYLPKPKAEGDNTDTRF